MFAKNDGVDKGIKVTELVEEESRREFNFNLIGPWRVIRMSLRRFPRASGIDIGSGASRSYPARNSIYTASNAGLNAMMGLVANEARSTMDSRALRHSGCYAE